MPSISKIKIFTAIIAFAFTMLPNTSWAEQKLIITVAATQNSIKEYKALPDTAKKVPYTLNNIPDEINTRCVVGLIIIKNALMLGGIDAKYKFAHMPNVRRETDEVAKGNAVIGSHLLGKRILDAPKYKSKMYLSSEVTSHGEFQKGVYCLPDNKKMMAVKNLDDLRKAGKALIQIHWDNEYEVLTRMGIKKIEKGPTSCSLFKMLKAGRADWIPMGFRNPPDMSIIRNGIKIVPVPGIKICLVESRHFLISQRHPHGKLIYDALEKGLAVMRKQGTLKKLLKQGGYTCPAARNWTVLNAKHSSGLNNH